MIGEDQAGMPDPHVLPANPGAEQVLLGAILRDNGLLKQTDALLSPERFSDPIHGVIYLAIRRCVEAGQVADAELLRAEFEHTGSLDEVGGTSYLGQLKALDLPTNVGNYVDSIHDAWLRRALIDAAEHLNALAADALQSAYGESASEFGDSSGKDQAAYLAARLRGLLATIEAELSA